MCHFVSNRVTCMANFSRALKHTFVGQTMEWKEMSNPHTAAAHAAVDKGEQSTRNERAYVYALVSVCVCVAAWRSSLSPTRKRQQQQQQQRHKRKGKWIQLSLIQRQASASIHRALCRYRLPPNVSSDFYLFLVDLFSQQQQHVAWYIDWLPRSLTTWIHNGRSLFLLLFLVTDVDSS